ncbi:hypothetical protein BS78_07G088500 [Paspalum vaginatum]|nr:hypothetical protein BS78_07G088500 [Paspalum vaginatum]
MATVPSSSSFQFLLLPSVLQGLPAVSSVDYIAQPSSRVPLPSLGQGQCNCPKENETSMLINLHQFPGWSNVPNPNEISVIITNKTNGFGGMVVDDWSLTDLNGDFIGRAQGFHIQDGQTVSSWYFSHIFAFQSSWWFAGSTLQVVGIYPHPGGQWSITGGTGAFTML